MSRYKSIKKRIFEIISKAENGDLASQFFDWSIMALIALSIISIILESFAGIYEKWHSVFQVFEIITVVVFTVEYILRVWTADLLYPKAKHPRLKYIFSIMAIGFGTAGIHLMKKQGNRNNLDYWAAVIGIVIGVIWLIVQIYFAFIRYSQGA